MFGFIGCGYTAQSSLERNDTVNYSRSPLSAPVGAGIHSRTGVRRSCECSPCENPTLSGQSLAMVYSPVQEFDNLYEPEAGLCAGTIFRDLEKPFWGAGRA